MEHIKQFIEENRKKGYSDVQIRQHLIQNNILPEQVDVVFCQIPNRETIAQIKQWFAQGYQLQQVKQSLQQQGYGDAYITLLASKAFEKTKNHTPVIFASSVFVIILAVFVVFFFLNQTTSKQLLDVHAAAVSSTVKAGAPLKFVVDASNFGSTERVDIVYTYHVVGTEISKQETIAVQTSVSKSASIDIPSSLAPGSYDLDVTATYGGNIAKAAFSFTVVAQQTVDQNIPVVVTDPADVAAPVIACVEDWECTEFPSDCPASGTKSRTCTDINSCGTAITRPNLLQSCSQASGTSCDNLPGSLKTNCIAREAKEAKDASMCSSLQDSSDCFSGVAVAMNSTETCQFIADSSARDSCMLKVAVQGNADACGLITSAGVRQACRESVS